MVYKIAARRSSPNRSFATDVITAMLDDHEQSNYN